MGDFPPMIPHSKPDLGDDVLKAARLVTETAMIGPGPQLTLFEQEMAVMHGAIGAVGVNSGSAALHLALDAIQISPGDEVLVPGYVCTALVNTIHYLHAVPVLCDCLPETFNIDPADYARKLTPKSRAVILPHMFGNPAPTDEILRHGVPVIEDCAQSIGASDRFGLTGSRGIVSIFSFHPTKMMTTGGGGMALSKDRDIVERMHDRREYDQRDDYVLRYNYVLNDLAAAIGRSQLARLGQFIKRRRELAQRYTLCPIQDAVKVPVQQNGGVYYRYVVRTPHADKLAHRLMQDGIQARKPVYKPLNHYLGIALPGCDEIHRTSLSIPLYPALTDDDANTIVGSLAWREMQGW